MCLAPSLIVNPQVRYFLNTDPLNCSVYFSGQTYINQTIFANTIFQSLIRSTSKKQYTALDIYEYYRNSYLNHSSARYPLFVLCPCGRCLECREAFRKEVQSRAVIEASHCGTVIFYTLTYSDTYLPRCGLFKPHIVNAFKRFRTYIDRYLNFDVTFTNLYVGEYGTDPRFTMRAHYHGLLFIKESLTIPQIFELESLLKGTHPIYTTRNLIGVWPYGRRFDFQIARNVVALTKYVTKYITKQYLALHDSDFSALREKMSYQNPMFVQLPKRIGLGCKYIGEYVVNILQTTDPYLSVRSLDGSVTRVRIPQLFIRKLIPSLSYYMPNAAYIYQLVKNLINLTSSHLSSFRGYINPFKTRLSSYDYLGSFTLKHKQYIQLKKHISLYYAFYSSSNHVLDRVALNSVIDDYLNHLESCCPPVQQYYDLIIKRKSNYLNLKILPDISTSELLEQQKIQVQKNVAYCKSKLMFSEFSCIS